MTLYIISFVAGILTVLSPCVLPVLPVVLGASATDKSKKNLYLTIISLGLSIFLFTFLLQTSFKFNPLFEFLGDRFWVTISGAIITFFGVVTIFPSLWDSLSLRLGFSTTSNKFLEKSQQKSGLAKSILLGASLGPVFTSCSPTYFVILGLITGSQLFEGVILLIIYILGLTLFLSLIGIFGYKLTNRLKFIADPHGLTRRIFGVLFIIIGIAIIFGLDKTLESYLLDQGVYDIFSQIELQFL